jgi:hypothetical protein
LLVNIPAALIMFGFGVAGIAFLRGGWWLLLFVGFILAWCWWSFTVPRWRRWALGRGAPPDKLQRLAAQTGLVWPKGWVFEKTEFKVDDEQPTSKY